MGLIAPGQPHTVRRHSPFVSGRAAPSLRATSVPLRLLASHRVLCQREADKGDDRIPLAVLCSRVIHQDADEAAAQLLAVRFDEKINQEFHRAGLI
jgi:hypothetical protein